jgi:hypothetical protein
LESESYILPIFNDKRRDAEMFPIGHIEHCAKALVRCKLSPPKKVFFLTAEVLLQVAAQSYFLPRNEGRDDEQRGN